MSDFMYIFRTAPAFTLDIQPISETVRDALEVVLNAAVNDTEWLQMCRNTDKGGFGIQTPLVKWLLELSYLLFWLPGLLFSAF